MASKLLCKISTLLKILLIIVSLAACTPAPPVSTSTPQPSPTATAAVCQPSEIQTSNSGFDEIEGTMHSDGSVWALLFFQTAYTKEELKIVWRVTGEEILTVEARHGDGTVVLPIWGPQSHTGSNWNRPGGEWGTGFNFPKPGCWRLSATRGATVGEIRLDILEP